MNKHFFLGAGLALVVAFAASSVFAQSLMPCTSLGGKMVTGAECDAADAASGVKPPTMMAPACAVGQLSTPQTPCAPSQFGQQGIDPRQQQMQSDNFVIDSSAITTAVTYRDKLKNDLASGKLQTGRGMDDCMLFGKAYQMSVKDCLQSLDEIIAGKGPSILSNQQTPQINSQNQQFNQQQFLPQQQNQNFQQNFQPIQQNQQSLFGQQQFNQQQTPSQIITPTIRSSSTTLVSKGLKLALKMQSSLNSKYSQAKGKTKKLAAVRSIAKKLPTLCRYISSGDDEADLDENAFDCDAFVAEVSEPIGDALKAKDYEVAYESTVAALESFGQVFDSLQQ